MEKITVTQGGDSSYMSYLYGRITDKFSFLPADCTVEKEGERTKLIFGSEKKYSPYIRNFAEENIADIIAIGYKYDYFDRMLFLPLLSGDERAILLTALVAADYAEDRDFVRKKLKGNAQYCIDGVFNFRLRELRLRWRGVAEYVPAEFSSEAMQSFLEYIIAGNSRKIYVKGGDVYDGEYRKLTKSALLGKRDAVREILLSGAGNIFAIGKTDSRTEEFLKKFYKGKVVFC